MGSQIRRRKQGNMTITQNLTKGTMTVTHSHTPRGSTVGMSTSTKSGGGKTRHRTTVTQKHGEGIFSRTTKSRTHSNSRKGRGWLAKALFGDGKKKKSSSNRNSSDTTKVEKVATEESKVNDTPKDTSASGDGAGALAVIVLCIVGYYLIVAPIATLKVIAVIAGVMFFFAFWHVILMTFLAILGLGVVYQLFKWMFS